MYLNYLIKPLILGLGINLITFLYADTEITSSSELLHAGKPVEVYIAPGRSTTLVFRSKVFVSSISLSSAIITYKYDKKLNQIELSPSGRSVGLETNLNLRLGEDVYVLIIKIVNDVRVQYVRVFSLEGEEDSSDEDLLKHAKALKPAYIDFLGAIKITERMRKDSVFRLLHKDVHHIELNYIYIWNNCFITLNSFDQFIDRDLLVFRITWINSSSKSLCLNPHDLQLWIRDKKLPVTAITRKKINPLTMPGDRDEIYLAIQGYRLSRRNSFELKLPTEMQ